LIHDKKIETKLNKITNIETKLNIEHWFWPVTRWIDMWTFKKSSNK